MAVMLLKFSSASWTRPRYFRHRPFSNFTKHSSSTEYSFSENRAVREENRLVHSWGPYSVLGPGDTGDSHVVPILRELTLGRKDRLRR